MSMKILNNMAHMQSRALAILQIRYIKIKSLSTYQVNELIWQ